MVRVGSETAVEVGDETAGCSVRNRPSEWTGPGSGLLACLPCLPACGFERVCVRLVRVRVQVRGVRREVEAAESGFSVGVRVRVCGSGRVGAPKASCRFGLAVSVTQQQQQPLVLARPTAARKVLRLKCSWPASVTKKESSEI